MTMTETMTETAAQQAEQVQAYSEPERERDPWALPDLLLHHWPDAMRAEADGREAVTLPSWDEYGADHVAGLLLDGAEAIELERCGGWFWVSCFPGCIPEGEFSGPFDTYADALADARGE